MGEIHWTWMCFFGLFYWIIVDIFFLYLPHIYEWDFVIKIFFQGPKGQIWPLWSICVNIHVMVHIETKVSVKHIHEITYDFSNHLNVDLRLPSKIKSRSQDFFYLLYYVSYDQSLYETDLVSHNCIPRTKYVRGILWFSRRYAAAAAAASAAAASADTSSFSR